MKRAKLSTIVFLLTAELTWSQIPELVPGWPYRSGALDFTFYALGRFADDGPEKHVFFNTHLGQLHKFNLDGSFANGWPISCDTLIFGSDPVIFDIDNDGQFEMLNDGARRSGGGYAYSLLFLVDDNGLVMPGFPIRISNPYDLTAADMDNDGEYEIIYFSSREGVINCLDRYGNTKPGWPISLPDDCIAGIGGSIGDLDLNGANELVTAGSRNIYAFGSDGVMMDGFPIALADESFVYANGNLPNILVDFDQDGYLEIIMGGNNWVYWPPPTESCFVAVYEHSGQPKPGWPRYFSSEWVVSSITPSDINNDGTIELGFQGLQHHFIGLDGMELPGWPVTLTRPDGGIRGSHSDLSIADIDGDGDCELFSDFNAFYADSLGHDSLWYHGYSYLFAIDHFGQALAGYPLVIEGSNFKKPPCFSLNPVDNRLYMSVSTDLIIPWGPPDSVFLELYHFPDSTGPPDQWPMLSHDNLHTRNYNFVDRVTSVEDGDHEILPKSPILKQNYPNPFNLSTIIEFTLPKKEHVTLSVYDILGRKVADIYDREMEAGTHKHRLSMDVPSGIYLYRLRAGNTAITRKMALVK
jgi:hypothetical protein